MGSRHTIEHCFRHDYGRLVARLVRLAGMQNVELVEDAVQASLLSGLEVWTAEGMPDNPTAWLYQVAKNRVLTQLRQDTHRGHLLQLHDEFARPAESSLNRNITISGFDDDLLALLFFCCDDDLPIESQLVFTLKALCGFDIKEIALRLFSSEANVYKRYSRAKQKLKLFVPVEWDLSPEHIVKRLPRVQQVIYLLFTEGYLSVNHAYSIRRELCEEALRFALLLANHRLGSTADGFALVALMLFNLARMDSRQDASGALLLLEEQDRFCWDQEAIAAGMTWLERSACGEHYSRYHAEASVAAEHCVAIDFASTRWDRIASSYQILEQQSPSIMHRMSRAMAVAQWKGPEEGLALIADVEPPSWLLGAYQWYAVMADLHRRCGNRHQAQKFIECAIELAPTPALRAMMLRRFD